MSRALLLAWRSRAVVALLILTGGHVLAAGVVLGVRGGAWPAGWSGLPSVPLALVVALVAALSWGGPGPGERGLRAAAIVEIILELVLGAVVGIAALGLDASAAVNAFVGAAACLAGVSLLVSGRPRPTASGEDGASVAADAGSPAEPQEPDDAEPAGTEPVPDGSTSPVWQPQEAVGAVWRRAGDAATGAPGWQPGETRTTWPGSADHPEDAGRSDDDPPPAP